MTDVELNLMFEEWAQWILGGAGPTVPKCVSAESRFTHPQSHHWHPEEPEPEAPLEWRAFRMERAIASLPELQRDVVRAEYTVVRQRQKNGIFEDDSQFKERKRRIARVPMWYYDTLLQDGREQLRCVLKSVRDGVSVRL